MFYKKRLVLVMLLAMIIRSTESSKTYVIKNIYSLNSKQRTLVKNKLTDLLTMFRTYFEDNLDQCSNCSSRWPKTGNSEEQINIVDDAVYNVMLTANLTEPRYVLSQKDYEFLMQLERSIDYKVPVGSPMLKKEAMKIVQLVYGNTQRDMREADRMGSGFSGFCLAHKTF